jgi:hypothetical protein
LLHRTLHSLLIAGALIVVLRISDNSVFSYIPL